MNEVKVKMELFKAFSRAIAESDNLEILLNHLVRLAVSALQVKGSAIFCLCADSGELEALATFGLSPTYLTKGTVRVDRSIAATLEGRAVVIPDVTKVTGAQYPEEAKREGIRAIVSVPIVFSKEIGGVFRLYHHEVWELGEEDLDSLELLAANIGLAMAYRRLLSAVRTISEVLDYSLLKSEIT